MASNSDGSVRCFGALTRKSNRSGQHRGADIILETLRSSRPVSCSFVWAMIGRSSSTITTLGFVRLYPAVIVSWDTPAHAIRQGGLRFTLPEMLENRSLGLRRGTIPTWSRQSVRRCHVSIHRRLSARFSRRRASTVAVKPSMATDPDQTLNPCCCRICHDKVQR